MRMWLCDPEILCQKHLCGEHLEMHMFIGTIKEGKKIDGFLKNNLLQPRYIMLRHQELAKEMKNRGYNHKSPLNEKDCMCVLDLTIEQQYWEVNRDAALKDLLDRCPKCRKRFIELKSF